MECCRYVDKQNGVWVIFSVVCFWSVRMVVDAGSGDVGEAPEVGRPGRMKKKNRSSRMREMLSWPKNLSYWDLITFDFFHG